MISSLPDLDNRSPIPLHFQLREILRQEIETRRWRVGEEIPSEREISERFGVSRTTVRQAVDSLVRDGLLERQRGRNSRVSKRKVSEPLPALLGFTEDLEAQGFQPENRVLAKEVVPAPDEVIEALGLEAGQPVLRLERLRLVEADPIALHVAQVPLAVGISPDMDFSGSLYELLEKSLGVELGSGWTTIELSRASLKEAGLLRVRRNAPLLRMRRAVFTEDGHPIEFMVGVHRPDRYQYTVQLRRRR